MVVPLIQAKAPPPRPSPSRGEGEGHVGWEFAIGPSGDDCGLFEPCSPHSPVSLQPHPSQSLSPPPPLRGRAGVGRDLGRAGKVSP